jgi:hypothetical protein
MAELTSRKQRGSGRPFQPGRSGNPRGRPLGSRNATTRAVEALLDGEAQAITRKAIEAALGGDMVAIRLVLDRVSPPRKSRPISIDLPPTGDAAGVAAAQQVVVQALAQGELLLDEATALSGLLEGRRKALETEELEMRIQRLEQRRK